MVSEVGVGQKKTGVPAPPSFNRTPPLSCKDRFSALRRRSSVSMASIWNNLAMALQKRTDRNMATFTTIGWHVFNDFYVPTQTNRKKHVNTKEICWKEKDLQASKKMKLMGKSQVATAQRHNLQFFVTANTFGKFSKGKRFLHFLHPETTSPAKAEFSHPNHPTGEPDFCSTRLLR